MIYKNFQDKRISLLGFGTMRLPTLQDGKIDQNTFEAMVDTAMKAGINYYDTSYVYHQGFSEEALGKALKKYPRSSYYIADKFPGHMIFSDYTPAPFFEDMLKKLGTDHIDFYLLHNVYENSIDTYTDKRWGIIEYFIEQKKAGRISHLGFSTHARLDALRDFLDRYGNEMEFCQIQLNYLDWTLQNAKEKYELLTERHIPVWVMEPLRGGNLTKLNEENTAKLKALRPDDSVASWGFRFLQGLENVQVILSGMSNPEALADNLKTFENDNPLDEKERNTLLNIAETLKNSIPCTACRYCCDGCPMGLDIPTLISSYNDFKFNPCFASSMFIEGLPEEKKPSACIGCGACAAVCPQKINIPQVMRDFTKALSDFPSWREMCEKRTKGK